MGIETVAVYSEADASAFHLRHAERAVSLGDGPPSETYLSIPRLIEAARRSGAAAVHPGYGFLSESAEFARAVEEAGMLWIGPPPAAMEAMGLKIESRARMEAAGVPVVPGSRGSSSETDELGREAERLGYPVLVKASAGGGGKGMSRVERPQDLPRAVEEAQRISLEAFGDDSVYLEKLLERPRHVEFQVFGDRHGEIVHLFERECSVQRRHQKIIEETPSPALDPTLRERMGRSAVEAARAVGYVGAGTVEFLLDDRKNFYFLEMNTRLQVEHPVTEETLGIDLVRAQLEIAAGEPLPEVWRAGQLVPSGHAIELRLYAEDPIEFLPRSGRVLEWMEPSGPGIRLDSGVERGSVVGLEYDPLLAKLVAHGADRRSAIARARRALSEWVVLGLQTNRALLSRVLESETFAGGGYTTDLVETLQPAASSSVPDSAWIAAALAFSGATPTHPLAGRDPWAEASSWRTGA
jgi:acetyl/propionyl-CoA carboxylase alpha subunit